MTAVIEDVRVPDSVGKREREQEDGAQIEEPRKRTFHEKIADARERAVAQEKLDLEEFQKLVTKQPMPSAETIAKLWAEAIERTLMDMVVQDPELDCVGISFDVLTARIQRFFHSDVVVENPMNLDDHRFPVKHRFRRASEKVIKGIRSQVPELVISYFEHVEGMRVDRAKVTKKERFRCKIRVSWRK